ncbi:putative Phosphatidylserine decarboxylase [Paratrimastix pyriformis]|uniref:Phosphatidylserine decarboxylase n=1 Tax=Paratrimastix pyriformis TaxID=342808 RepID=A0ABQ8U6L2_9EUKA|nr:putative Phosphatidylserine decarboxylase [Paratrimastix pyriformis]
MRGYDQGDNFTVDTLCGRDPALTHLLANGSFVISRLAPQDYHRIHFPVETEIRSEQDIPGTYYTVSPLAVCKNIDVYHTHTIFMYVPLLGPTTPSPRSKNIDVYHTHIFHTSLACPTPHSKNIDVYRTHFSSTKNIDVYHTHTIFIKNIDVYTENRRRVLRCWSPIIGEYVIVMVGATMVGSCIRTAVHHLIDPASELNTRYHKGDEIGYFAFGGSTTLLLFPPGVITLDADLVQNSAKPMESLVRMGMHIGAAGPRAPGAAAPAATATAAPATPATAAAPAAPAPAPAEPLPATAAAVAGLPSPPPVATA